MQAVMIYPSGLIVAAEVNDDPLAIQGAVGGYFEPVRFNCTGFVNDDGLREPVRVRFNCTGFVNDDGLRLELPYNAIASALTHRNIVGNMLVCGPVNEAGDVESVPANVVRYLLTIHERMPKTVRQFLGLLFKES